MNLFIIYIECVSDFLTLHFKHSVSILQCALTCKSSNFKITSRQMGNLSHLNTHTNYNIYPFENEWRISDTVEWEIHHFNSKGTISECCSVFLEESVGPTGLFNPFTTEARFYVLNAMAFST